MFSSFFINRPIFASVLSIVIVLGGSIAVGTLPEGPPRSQSAGLPDSSLVQSEGTRAHRPQRTPGGGVPPPPPSPQPRAVAAAGDETRCISIRVYPKAATHSGVKLVSRPSRVCGCIRR